MLHHYSSAQNREANRRWEDEEEKKEKEEKNKNAFEKTNFKNWRIILIS